MWHNHLAQPSTDRPSALSGVECHPVWNPAFDHKKKFYMNFLIKQIYVHSLHTSLFMML